MKRSNLGWGALRISQELDLLGLRCSKKSVAKILKDNGFVPPKMKFTPIPWKNFLSYRKDSWAMDFTNIFDYLGNQIWVLVIINLSNRELIHINATTNPSRNWLIQQMKNISINGYNFPKSIIIDNDGIYGEWIGPQFLELFGINTERIPFKMPWKNAICERFNLTLKLETLNRIGNVSFDEIQKACFLYRKYYNNHRSHQGINGETPLENTIYKDPISNLDSFQVTKIKEVDGLVTRFELVG